MTRIPLYDATAPIVCTASRTELPVRLEVIARLHSYRTGVERTEHGLRLELPNRPDIEADLRQFTLDEKACCPFWGFAVDAAPDGLTLQWEGPPSVDGLLEDLYGYFTGDDPEAITALL